MRGWRAVVGYPEWWTWREAEGPTLRRYARWADGETPGAGDPLVFIDKERDSTRGRYTVWKPGAADAGAAKRLGGFAILRDAMICANAAVES